MPAALAFNLDDLSVEMYDYIKLSLADKATVLWEEGIFVDKYIDVKIITNLYHLKNFYVEVVLCNQEGRIKEITPFRSGKRLDKYLSHINLKELI
jgi:hypothetical protein